MKKFVRSIAGFLSATLLFSQTVFAAEGATRMSFTKDIINTFGIELSESYEDKFTDLEGEDAIFAAGAKSFGIMSGYADGSFKPDREITLEQAIVIAINAEYGSDFSYDEEITAEKYACSEWAKKQVAYAVENKLIVVGDLDLKAPITTDMAMAVINSIYNSSDGEADISNNDLTKIDNTIAPQVVQEAKKEITPEDRVRFEEILAKTDENLNAQESYRATGEFVMNQKMFSESIPEGSVESLDTKMSMDIAYEAPNKIYMEMTMNLLGEDLVFETLMNEKGMFQKNGEADWEQISETSIEDYIEQTMYMIPKEDVLGMKDSLTEMGEVEENGKKLTYFVVEIGSETFKGYMDAMIGEDPSAFMGSFMPNLGYNDEENEEAQAALDMAVEMLKNMEINIEYKYFIDESTMLYDRMDMDMDVLMDMDLEGMAEFTKGVQIKMEMNVSGTAVYSGYGEAFEFPEV